MKYLATLGDRQFDIVSNVPLTQEQVNRYATQKLGIPAAQGGGCPSCAGKADAKAAAGSGMVKLGTATCGGPYLQNSSHTLTGSVTSGGTAPFTYTWTITKPDTTTTTLPGAVQTGYVFAQTGTYGIRLDVSDSCPGGAKTDFSTCNVTVATCVDPACTINIA